MQVSIYRRDINGKIRLIANTTLDRVFRQVHERLLKDLFTNNIDDRIGVGPFNWYFSTSHFYPYVPGGMYGFVAYDEKDRVIAVDRLIGLYRDWWNVRPRRRYTYRFPGRKRKSGSWLRYMKTTQEIRWRDAWDDEDVVVNYRRRNYLPDAWDDFRVGRRGDGWKNYRKTQYKN